MEDRLGYQVNLLRELLRARLEEALRPIGLTPAQFGLLRFIGQHPDLSAAELARRHLITAQSTHEVLTHLERAGLISRRSHPLVRRVRQISVTTAGSAALERGIPEATAVEEELLTGFTARDRAQLARLLRRARQNLSQAPAGGDQRSTG